MIQVPPDSTGKLVETVTNASTQEREVMVIGSPTTSLTVGQNLAPVTSSAGLVVNISSGTITSTAATNPWSSAPGFNVPIVSVSSGLVQISGTPTVTATAATNPWSSAPGFNIPTVSVSSGLSQVSAVQVSPTSSVAGAGLLVVTSSFGLVTQSTQPITITSGTVTLSSVHTVTANAGTGTFTVLSASSGLVQISGTPTVLSASSGLIQISGTPAVTSTSVLLTTGSIISLSSGTVTLSSVPTVFSASSGGVQAFIPISPTSSVAGAGFGPVTSSAGVLASLTSGTVSLSSQITVTATAATNPWSSAPGFNLPIVSVSSGLIQISGTPTVTATAATNPWSSAPGFNMPVVSVSSGLIQSIDIASVTSAPAILSTWFQSTGGAASVLVNSSPGNFRGYALFNSTAAIRSVKIYNSSAAPAVGSTVNIITILEAPGSTGGGGANMMLPAPGVFASNGLGFTMTANIGATDTGAPGLNDLTLTLYFV